MRIVVSDITKKYRKKNVLNGLSFEAESGDCIGLVGENGCGKSTLLGILAGTVSADTGSFVIEGDECINSRKKIVSHVGFVPQENALFAELSAYDNMLLWYSKKEIEDAAVNGEIKRLGVDAFIKNKVGKLSGGMKKRIAIANATMGKPDILLLDEPSAALDIACKEIILDYINEFCKNGGIAIIATHDLKEIESCNKLFNIHNGLIRECSYDGDLAAFSAFLFGEKEK